FLQSCGEPVHKGGGLRMQFHLVSFPHENPTQEDTAWSPVPQVIPESPKTKDTHELNQNLCLGCRP
ncbi:MAG: hypothetical protein Q8N17_09745, partial [Burkholderiaceae bacterium]|nr:hypothetical protein [Burkholderiaceae bacterium]